MFFKIVCFMYVHRERERERGYYIASRRYETSLRVLSAANE